MKTGIPVLLSAPGDAYLGVHDQQMRRLILFVDHPAVVDVCDFVEGQQVVELHLVRRVRILGAEIALDPLHPLVAAVPFQPVHESEATPAGNDSGHGVEHAGDRTVVEGLMEVPLLPELLARPGCFEERLVLRQLCGRVVLAHQRIECGLRCQHP